MGRGGQGGCGMMGWAWGQDMCLVHDDQTVSIGTFSHAHAQENYGQKDHPVESFARGFKWFHTCLDAKNGTLLEKNYRVGEMWAT